MNKIINNNIELSDNYNNNNYTIKEKEINLINIENKNKDYNIKEKEKNIIQNNENDNNSININNINNKIIIKIILRI